MRTDYTLHSITFEPSVYRDEQGFKHTSEHYKNKRWKVSGLFEYVGADAETRHPDDKFVESGDSTYFTEWRRINEEFNPQEFLLNLVTVFERIAKKDMRVNVYNDYLFMFIDKYGNDHVENLTDDHILDYIEYFAKEYWLKSVNTTPFKTALKRYHDQTYLFYSNCKLLYYLFNIKNYDHVLGDIEYFKTKNYTVIIK